MTRYVKWIWLAEKCGAGSLELLPLIEAFDSVDEIYEADFDTYVAKNVSERLAEDLCDKNLDDAIRAVRFCQAQGVGILIYNDSEYPRALKMIKNPPPVLYYKGKLPDFNRELFISMVGTRRMSEYGMRAAYKIAYEVASSGACVVSGMALGIDGVCNAAAIAAGGRTVAVLGCGIDVVYPKEHDTLLERILKNGAVITEFAPGTLPRGYNFPIRNRLISGLSRATLIVDADVSSGAMITAKHAILQGRDVYAVPSNIDAKNSTGTNTLIRDGAQAVLCGNDIIKNYAASYKDVVNVQALRDAEARSSFNEAKLREMGVGSRGETRLGANNTRKTRSGADQKPVTVAEKPEKKQNEGATQIGYEAWLEPVTQRASSIGDRSLDVLDKLSEKQRAVFEAIPLDMPVTVDYLTKTGLKLGDVIAALTVLEVKGLVASLPGAIYVRK